MALLQQEAARKQPPLKCIDLFSGCGGIAYGLRGLCSTVLFCDSDAACHTCLRSNMRRGRLEAAPISSDVRSLSSVPRAELVTAGFPCQDISFLGSQAGFEGEA